MPSNRSILPLSGRLARRSISLISDSEAPSKTGVEKYSPSALAAQPRWVSRIWPTFIREGTPSGLSTISTGVPSGRYGMSSSGRIRAMTPLLPWRPAILSPTDSLRFIATYTLTILITPGGSSSPRRSLPSCSSCRVFRIWICFSVFSSSFLMLS